MLYAQSGTILIAHRWIFSPQSQVEVGLSPYTTDHVNDSDDTSLYTHSWVGGDKHFLMIKILIENVSEANILSSEASKPAAGARISGPVGP